MIKAKTKKLTIDPETVALAVELLGTMNSMERFANRMAKLMAKIKAWRGRKATKGRSKSNRPTGTSKIRARQIAGKRSRSIPSLIADHRRRGIVPSGRSIPQLIADHRRRPAIKMTKSQAKTAIITSGTLNG